MQSERSSLKLTIDAPAQIFIEDGAGRRFGVHPIWLRERCQDAASMDLLTGQRLEDPSDFDLELSYVSVSETARGRLQRPVQRRARGGISPKPIFSAEAALPPGEHDCAGTGSLDRIARGFAARELAGESRQSELRLGSRHSCAMDSSFSAASPRPSAGAEGRLHISVCRAKPILAPSLMCVRSPEANRSWLTHRSSSIRTPTTPIVRPYRASSFCTVSPTKPSGGLSTLVDGFAVAERCASATQRLFASSRARWFASASATRTRNCCRARLPIELDARGNVRTIRLQSAARFRAAAAAGRADGLLSRTPRTSIMLLRVRGVRNSLPAQQRRFGDVRQLPPAAWPDRFQSAGGPAPFAGLLYRHRWAAQPLPRIATYRWRPPGAPHESEW